MKYSITIDVPDMTEGLRFYRDALGMAEIARPVATYVILDCGGSHLGLMEKAAGTAPAANSPDVRRYERHWTPVHIDFHVEDFNGALAKAVEAGAKCERKFEGGNRPAIAFCSDPFGHGFCLMGKSAKE